jgi:hypothetical protein
MDLMERLRLLLDKDEGKSPWPYGFDLSEDSDALPAFLQVFGREELLAISKHNSFIKERNLQIQRLKSLGLSFPMLVDLTGISMSHLNRIAGRNVKLHKK